MSDATTTPPVPEESSPPRKSGDVPVTTPGIGAAMAELARTLQREHSSEPGTLQAVTTAAVRAVPGAAHAVISLVIRQKMVQAHAATDPSAGRLDELQTKLDDGPCLRAVWEQQTVHIPAWPPNPAGSASRPPPSRRGWVPCSASSCSSRATTSGR